MIQVLIGVVRWSGGGRGVDALDVDFVVWSERN